MVSRIGCRRNFSGSVGIQRVKFGTDLILARRRAPAHYLWLATLAAIHFQQLTAGAELWNGSGPEVAANTSVVDGERRIAPLPGGGGASTGDLGGERVAVATVQLHSGAVSESDLSGVVLEQSKRLQWPKEQAAAVASLTTTSSSSPDSVAAAADSLADSSRESTFTQVDGDSATTDAAEDVVISASEILDDNNSQRGQQSRVVAADRNRKHPSSDRSSANCTSNSDLLLFGANSEDTDSSQLQQQHYINSRLLLQILVIGLFGMVSLSLVVVYTIKFCVCRRRKRLIQRNLIADCHAGHLEGAPSIARPLQPFSVSTAHSQCTCPAPNPPDAATSSAPPMSLDAPSVETHIRRLRSALPRQAAPSGGASLWHALTRGASRGRHRRAASPLSAADLYQQLALAERLAIQAQLQASHHYRESYSRTHQPLSVCASCLSAPTTSGDHSHHHQMAASSCPCASLQAPTTRPPAYTELFGYSPTTSAQMPPPSTTLTTVTTTGDQHAITPRVVQQSLPDHSESASSSSGASSAGTDDSGHGPCSDLQQLTQQHQQPLPHRNLLVKLNLNKTKLLSADDLVLLSKLIDVPIVVQQQQQQSVVGGAASARAEDGESQAPLLPLAAPPTTLIEELEDEDEPPAGELDNRLGALEQDLATLGDTADRCA